MAEQANLQTDALASPASVPQRVVNGVHTLWTFTRRYPVGAVAGVILVIIGGVSGRAGVFAPEDPLYVD